MAHSLTWNGTAFSTYGLIVRLPTPAPTLSRIYDSMQTQNRVWAGKGQGAAGVFNLPVIIVGTSAANTLSRVSTIRGLLDQEDECTLAFDMYTDRYWMAKFNSLEGDYTSSTTWEGTLIFTCHDRAAYATSASTQTETLTENKSAGYGGTINAIYYDSSSDYVYVAGTTTGKVYKLDKISLTKIAEGPAYGGSIRCICGDDSATGYIYYGGDGGAGEYDMVKLDKATMAVEVRGPDYGGVIYSCCKFGNYIFYGGSGGAGQYDVAKLLITNMTTIVRSADLGGIIYCSAVNSTHVFVGHADGAGHDHVGRYLITDLSYVDESDDYGDVIRAVCLNSTTCFWCGDLDEVWYAAVGALTSETQSGDLGSDLNAICVDDDYIYVAGDDNVVYKLDIAFTASASYVAKSDDYGGDLYGMAIDTVNQWLYIGGATTQTVWKLDSRRMPKLLESSLCGSGIYSIVSDENYIYCGTIATNHVLKLRKSDLVLMAKSIATAATVSVALDEDGDYLYCSSGTYVWKLNIDDLTIVAISPDYRGSDVVSICAPTGDYIYYGGNGGAGEYDIVKLDKATMAVEVRGPDYGGIIYSIVVGTDGTYVYAGGATTQRVREYQTADLAYNSQSDSYADTILGLAIDSTNIYCCGAADTVWRITIANLTVETISADLGFNLQGICVDNDFIYVVGVDQVVFKLDIAFIASASYVAKSTVYGGGLYAVIEDEGLLYIGGDTVCTVQKLDKRVLWQRSDHEITITSAGTAKCGLDFASTASQANYWQQTYENQTSGKEFDWEGTQANGKVLDVDSALWYVTNDGATAMSGVSGEFLTLSPGANVLYLENVTGTVVFGWTDRFA